MKQGILSNLDFMGDCYDGDEYMLEEEEEEECPGMVMVDGSDTTYGSSTVEVNFYHDSSSLAEIGDDRFILDDMSMGSEELELDRDIFHDPFTCHHQSFSRFSPEGGEERKQNAGNLDGSLPALHWGEGGVTRRNTTPRRTRERSYTDGSPHPHAGHHSRTHYYCYGGNEDHLSAK